MCARSILSISFIALIVGILGFSITVSQSGPSEQDIVITEIYATNSAIQQFYYATLTQISDAAHATLVAIQTHEGPRDRPTTVQMPTQVPTSMNDPIFSNTEIAATNDTLVQAYYATLTQIAVFADASSTAIAVQ